MTSPSAGDRDDRRDRRRLEQERGVGAVEPGVDRVDRLGGGLGVADGAAPRRPRRRCRPAARGRRRAASTSRRAERRRRRRAGTARTRRGARSAARRRARVHSPNRPRAAVGRGRPRRSARAAVATATSRSTSNSVVEPAEQRRDAVVAQAADDAVGRQDGQRLARPRRGTASACSRTPDPPRTSGDIRRSSR